jgi:hypothetical protein
MSRFLKLSVCLCLLCLQGIAQKNASPKAEMVEGIFIPSDAQLQKIKEIERSSYAKLRSVDSVYGPGAATKERAEKVAAIKARRENAITQVLGSENYVLYKRQTSFSQHINDSLSNKQKQRMLAMSSRLNLTTAETDSLTKLLTNFEYEKKLVFLTPNTSAEIKKKRILEVKEQYWQRIKALISDDRFKKFKEAESK